MIIVETDSSETAALRRMADACRGEIELFRKSGGRGYLAFSRAAGGLGPGVVLKRVKRLFSSGRWGPGAGAWLFCVGLRIPVDYREEFLVWYRMEHLSILLECADWDGCRFVEQRVPHDCQFYALHQLVHPRALDSPQRMRSRATPWFARFKRHCWFDEPFTRTLYERISL